MGISQCKFKVPNVSDLYFSGVIAAVLGKVALFTLWKQMLWGGSWWRGLLFSCRSEISKHDADSPRIKQKVCVSRTRWCEMDTWGFSWGCTFQTNTSETHFCFRCLSSVAINLPHTPVMALNDLLNRDPVLTSTLQRANISYWGGEQVEQIHKSPPLPLLLPPLLVSAVVSWSRFVGVRSQPGCLRGTKTREEHASCPQVLTGCCRDTSSAAEPQAAAHQAASEKVKYTVPPPPPTLFCFRALSHYCVPTVLPWQPHQQGMFFLCSVSINANCKSHQITSPTNIYLWSYRSVCEGWLPLRMPTSGGSLQLLLLHLCFLSHHLKPLSGCLKVLFSCKRQHFYNSTWEGWWVLLPE